MRVFFLRLQLANSDTMAVFLQRSQDQPPHIAQLLALMRQDLCCDAPPHGACSGDDAPAATLQKPPPNAAASILPASVLGGFAKASKQGSEAGNGSEGDSSSEPADGTDKSAQRAARAQAWLQFLPRCFPALVAAGLEQEALTLLCSRRVLPHVLNQVFAPLTQGLSTRTCKRWVGSLRMLHVDEDNKYAVDSTMFAPFTYAGDCGDYGECGCNTCIAHLACKL